MKTDPKSDKRINKVHFMGIGGSGIVGAASLADKFGFKVTGCDKQGVSAYTKKIEKGHSSSHLRGVDLVVVSPALFYIKPQEKEFLEAKKRGILMTWQKFLGSYLTTDKKVVCVAGTHGKSTTTAMVGKLFEDSGYDPVVMVGAHVNEWGGNGRFGKGDYFVIEADEFNNNFLNYSPEVVILNNIEFDHPDFFKSEKDMFLSYQKFLDRMVGIKILIANIDSPGVRKLLGMFEIKPFKIIEFSPKKEKLGFKLNVPGRHNEANALGISKLAGLLGIKKEDFKKSLMGFKGIGRRMELLGSNSLGAKIYDDYAHHPTAVAETLKALRSIHKDRKIWAVFEPHSYSRTKALLSSYKNAFDDSDEVIITPIFKARDRQTFGLKETDLVKVIDYKKTMYIKSFDLIIKKLKKELNKEDVVIVMGAGKSYVLARDILKI